MGKKKDLLINCLRKPETPWNVILCVYGPGKIVLFYLLTMQSRDLTYTRLRQIIVNLSITGLTNFSRFDKTRKALLNIKRK